MSKALTISFIAAVGLVGYIAYQQSVIKQQKEMNQVISDAKQSLQQIESNPNRKIIQIDSTQQSNVTNGTLMGEAKKLWVSFCLFAVSPMINFWK